MQPAEIKANPPTTSAPSAIHPAMVRRIIGAAAAIPSGALLGVSAWLTPSPTGLGTHTSLYQAPCGWIVSMNCPCPTCGMTTAFAHAADGNLPASFVAQPFGMVLAVGTAMTFLLGAYVAITGSRIASRLTRLWRPRLVWVIAALALISWVYKIGSHRGWL